MKKLLIILGFILQIPSGIWNQGTTEQHQEFIQAVAQQYGSENSCGKVAITVISTDNTVYVLAECVGDEI